MEISLLIAILLLLILLLSLVLRRPRQSFDTLTDQVKTFQKDLNDKFLRQVEGKGEIEGHLKRLQEMNTSLSQALSGNAKAQGSWGEVLLERVLSSSGLQEGRDYTREGKGLSLKDQEGRPQRPDVIIHLPENKHLIVDSKLTLQSFVQYASSETKEEKEEHLKNFLKATKAHISSLGEKKYQALDSLQSPEFVFMFMPIEDAFLLALQKDPSLVEFAWEKGVLLSGPTNLFSGLKIVDFLWRTKKQEENAQIIAEQGAKLYDKFASFIEDFQRVEEQLNKSQETHKKVMRKLSEGPGNLLALAEKLKNLGVSSKKTISSKN